MRLFQYNDDEEPFPSMLAWLGLLPSVKEFLLCSVSTPDSATMGDAVKRFVDSTTVPESFELFNWWFRESGHSRPVA
jgi:hypothetical protein